MGQAGNPPSSRLQWIGFGLLLILLDIRIQGFDILVDLAGALLVVWACHHLARHGGPPPTAAAAFATARNAAVVIALFTLTDLLPNQQRSIEIDETTAEVLFRFVFVQLAYLFVDLIMVWHLLEGVVRWAVVQGGEATTLSRRAARAQSWYSAAAIGHAIGFVVFVVFGGVTLVGVLSIVAGLITLVITIAVLLLLRQGARILAPRQRSESELQTVPRSALPPAVLPWFLLLAAMVAMYDLLVPLPPPLEDPSDFFTEDRPSPLDPVAAASLLTPEGLVEGPALASAPMPAFYAACNETGSTDDLLAWPLALSALDPVTGDRRWSAPTSNWWPTPGWLTNPDGADLVLTIEPQVSDVLPSVTAIDAQSGEAIWRSYVAADTLLPWGSGNGYFMIADLRYPRDGGFSQSVEGNYAYAADGSRILAPGAMPVGMHDWGVAASAERHGGDPYRALVGDGRPSVLHLSRANGVVTQGDAVPFDEIYTSLGNRSSLGDPVQLGSDVALVNLGSELGPNSKIIVYDADNGSMLWQMEDVRSAALATWDGRDVVVYDERNLLPETEAFTRELFVVDARDPNDLLWTAKLSVNDDGGNGFLGSTGDRLVFAVRSGGGAATPELLFIDTAEEAPPEVQAAERWGGGHSRRHHVDAEVVALASQDLASEEGDSLIVWTEQGRQEILTNGSIVDVSRPGQDLLVVVDSGLEKC